MEQKHILKLHFWSSGAPLIITFFFDARSSPSTRPLGQAAKAPGSPRPPFQQQVNTYSLSTGIPAAVNNGTKFRLKAKLRHQQLNIHDSD